MVSCSPVTRRPPFAPFPDAQVQVVRATPARVTDEARAALAGAGIVVALASPVDGYLETAWHEGFKLRCWATPAAPGTTRIFVEVVSRPTEDPSRTERDLERPVPPGHPGRALADRLLTSLRERFGAVP